MSRVAGIVPAAGRSLRMGRSKALLDAGGGRTFLERACATLARGGCAPVLVVLRDPHSPEAAIARRVGARVVANPDPDEGPVTSIRRALASLSSAVAGVVILPVDHPLVEASTVEELLAAFDADPATAAVVPTHEGQRGHPVVIGKALFPEVMEDELPEGLRTVLRRDPARVREVPVDDPGVLIDLDTTEAIRRHLPSALPPGEDPVGGVDGP
ncbi:MAG: nucleotidyltransferase family protein [Gemmatimonadetes bacterium]|nr:nucleotidyltransferase family protein [Gemmatimonadota bacterium]